MGLYRCGMKKSDGVVFNRTKICDNSNLSSTLTFTEDYHNYPLVCITIYNNSTGLNTSIVTTPDIIDAIFTYSNNTINFNEFGNNQYCNYNKVNNTSWERYHQRNCDVISIYGITCNKSITHHTLYNKEGYTASTEVSINTVESLFDYDFIFFSVCDGDSSETQPCINYAIMPGRDEFSPDKTLIPYVYNRYDNYYELNIKEHNIEGSKYYFCVQAIKIN